MLPDNLSISLVVACRIPESLGVVDVACGDGWRTLQPLPRLRRRPSSIFAELYAIMNMQVRSAPSNVRLHHALVPLSTKLTSCGYACADEQQNRSASRCLRRREATQRTQGEPPDLEYAPFRVCGCPASS